MSSNPNDDLQRAIARYLTRIPAEAPPGEIVVHNHVRPPLDPERYAAGVTCMAYVTPGMNGFRAWTWDEGDGRAVPCDCGWAPLLAVHYRVKGMGDPDPNGAA